MGNLAEFRRKYPEYDNKSDVELAEALYRTYYSDKPKEEVFRQLEVPLAATYAPIPAAPIPAAPIPAAPIPAAPVQPPKEPAPHFWEYLTNRDSAIRRGREYDTYTQNKIQQELVEDLKTQTGFWDRLGDFFNRGLLSARSGIKDVAAAIEGDSTLKKQFQEEARRYAANTNMPIKGETTWEDAKENWLKFLPLILEQGAQSLPEMIAYTNPLGAIGVGGSAEFGRQGRDVARLEGREDITGMDLARAAPTATAVTALNLLGVQGILATPAKTALGRVGKAALIEGGTEAIQGALQYLGPRVATGSDVDANELFENIAMGAIVGAGIGGGLRGTGEIAAKAGQAAAAPILKRRAANGENIQALAEQEYIKLAAAEVGKLMAADPGMAQQDAVEIVKDKAEELFAQAIINVANFGTEGAEGGSADGTGTGIFPTSGAGDGLADTGGNDPSVPPARGTKPPEADIGAAKPSDGGGLAGVGSDAAVPTAGKGEQSDTLTQALAPIYTAPDISARKAVAKPVVEKIIDNLYGDLAVPAKVLGQITTRMAQKAAAKEAFDPYQIVRETLEKQNIVPPQVAQPGVPTPPQATTTRTNKRPAKLADVVPPSQEIPTTTVNEDADEAFKEEENKVLKLKDTEKEGPAKVLADELAAYGYVNPLNNNELVVNGGGIQGEPVSADTFWLKSLRSIERGGGRAALQRLLATADQNGVSIGLDPEPFDAPSGKEMTRTELTEWYRGFGFEQQPDGRMVRPAAPDREAAPPIAYTPQQIVDNLSVFAGEEARDRELDEDSAAMFKEGVRDTRRGDFLSDEEILVAQGQESLDAYKAGIEWAQERISDAAKEATSTQVEEKQEAPAKEKAPKAKGKPTKSSAARGVYSEIEFREATGEQRDAAFNRYNELRKDGATVQDALRNTLREFVPESDLLKDIETAQQPKGKAVKVKAKAKTEPDAGDPKAEAEYMANAVDEAVKNILVGFMVGDRVRVGSRTGTVVGLDGDYVRVQYDGAKNPKAYNRVANKNVDLVSRPDTATTVSASKAGQDSEFGEEAGKLNADMAGLIQLLGANMYAARVAEVSVKELLQNAFDAVKGAISGKKAPSLYQTGNIKIYINRDDRTITITDNARGMTPEIVREAFFTVAGSDKSDLEPEDRSGGLGLAKMGFMMGSDYLMLDTVRDGMRVTVNATSKEIADSNFKIVKSPAPAGEHGTTVTVKIPESYIDPKSGDEKTIWFPFGKNSVPILGEPLIGPATVEFTYDNGYAEPLTETLALGENFPYNDYQKLEAKFDWGTADIYYGKNREKSPKHKVLSSGVYQFDHRFVISPTEAIPYDIIVNIKSSVEAKHPDYPFENSRERFKGRLKEDIQSLNGYLAQIARGAEAAGLKETMQNVVSLPRVEVGEDVKGLKNKLNKPFGEKEASQKLPELPTQVVISDIGVVDTRGRVVWEPGKNEKVKESSFEPEQAAPKRDEFMTELDQDPKNPILHNNTNFDPIEVGTPYGNPAQFFAELGSLLVEMKELLAKSGRWGYDTLLPENMFYAGIGIDKQYGGLHIKVPYKAVLINPFYNWGARTLAGVRSNILDTMVHEIAHTGDMGHGVGHNAEMVNVQQYLEDEGMFDYFRDSVMDILLRHESAYTAMREAYGQSTTQNVAKSLEDYGEEGNASRTDGRTGAGGKDTDGAVPTGEGRGGSGDIQTAASANPKRPKRGGRRGTPKKAVSQEEVDKAVDEAVSAKLTKGQKKQLEVAAGIRRRRMTALGKRIVNSRNEEETMGLIKKFVKVSRDPDGNAKVLASLWNSLRSSSMSPKVWQALRATLMTEDLFRLANMADMTELMKVESLMNEGYIPYVNKIMRRATEITEQWADFSSRFFEGNKVLDEVIRLADMYDVDPTKARTAAEYMKLDPQLLAALDNYYSNTDPKAESWLKAEVTQRENEIRAVYFGEAQEADEANGIEYEELRGWNDLSKKEYGGGKGKEIFTLARDFYRYTFDEHYRLLTKRVDDSKMDEEDAAAFKKNIDEMFAKARERTIYFPAKRFGDYWVSADKTFYMRDTLAEAEALAYKLEKQGKDVSIGERQNLLGALTKKDSSAALKNVLDILDSGKATDTKDIKDLVLQMYLTVLPEADMRRRFIHRKYTTGFSTDALRTFASTALASTNQLGRLAYNYQFDNAFREARKETEGLPNKPRLDTITKEIEMRVKSVLSPEGGGWADVIANGVAKASFMFLLSGASSAFINLTQLHIVGFPALSGEFGEAKTAAMAARYTASFFTGGRIPNPTRDKDGNVALQTPDFKLENSRYMRDLKKNDPERYEQMREAWKYAQDRDIIESTFVAGANVYERGTTPTGKFNFSQAARSGQVGTATARAAANTVNAMGFMFHHSEKIGRSIMYLSSFELAYERAIKQGKTAEEAGAEARELAAKLTNKAMFNFSNWNKPRIAKHPVGKLAFQMTSYRISMISLLMRSFAGMLPYFNKEGKAASARMFFGVAATTALYGGLRAPHIYLFVKGAFILLKWAESLLEDDDEEEEIEQGYLNDDTIDRNLLKYADKYGNEISKKSMEYYIRAVWIPETFGPDGTVAKAFNLSDKSAAKLQAVADMGLPALAGVDISNSVSLSDLWHPVDLKGNTPEVKVLEAMSRYVLGPSAAMVAGVIKGANAWQEGDTKEAFEAFLPAVIRNVIKAERLQEKGLQLGKNRDIQMKDPSHYTDAKTVLQTLGFRDAETSRDIQLDIQAGNIEEEVQKERSKLLNKFYRAMLEIERNPTDEAVREAYKVERDITKYNLNYPSNAITEKTKIDSIKQRRDDAEDKSGGLDIDDKIPVREPLVKERIERDYGQYSEEELLRRLEEK